MREEFLNYNQSVALKELGFNEPCFAQWVEIGGVEIKIFLKHHFDNVTDHVLAPLRQQALKWFRNYHRYNSYIVSSLVGDGWYFYIEDLNDRNNDLEPDSNKRFKTWQEAEIVCINKLIEIVKSKNENE